MNVYTGLSLSLLGQQPMQRTPPQELQSLGMSSAPEWGIQPNPNSIPGNLYTTPELQPSPLNGTGITVADPNYQMQQQIWQNLYGRQIGGAWGS